VPVWLLSLEEEVERLGQVTHRHNYRREILKAIPPVVLSYRQVRDRLSECACDGDD